MEPERVRPAVLLTGVGKRYDIVSAFAEHAFVIAADPSPLAPARYAAHVRAAPPRDRRPRLRAVPRGARRALRRARRGAAHRPRHRGAGARAEPARVRARAPTCAARRTTSTRPTSCCARSGCPSPPTVLPGEEPRVLPGDGQAAARLRRALDPPRRRPRGDGVLRPLRREGEPVMVQRLMGGAGVLDRPPVRPRRPLPQRDPAHDDRVARRRVDQGHGDRRPGARRARPAPSARRCAVRGPCTVQAFRDPEIGLGITDVNTRFGGAFPGADVRGAARPHLSRADRADGARRAGRAARGRVPRRAHVHALVLADRSSTSSLRPTGRDIVAAGPRSADGWRRSATNAGRIIAYATNDEQDDAPDFTDLELDAWRGFLRTHATLVRELDEELTAPPRPAAQLLRRAGPARRGAARACCACRISPTPCCSAAAGSRASSAGSRDQGLIERVRVRERRARRVRRDHRPRAASGSTRRAPRTARACASASSTG